MENENNEEEREMTEGEVDAIFEDIEALKQGLTEEDIKVLNSVNLSIR